jgi:hypothetical protein
VQDRPLRGHPPRSAILGPFLAALLLAHPVEARAEGGTGSIALTKSALPEEAPTSLFKAKLGSGSSDDAELLIKGSWQAALEGSFDLQAAEGGSFVFAAATPLLFTQSPDLSLDFLLFKRAFVEARVSEDVTEAKYAMGYRGGEGELLREARVGNAGVSFPSLPYLNFGEGSYRSFGASARIASGDFTGRAMLRYDQAQRVTKRFVGSSEITESEIAVNSFAKGLFMMTATRPAPNLVLYVQSVGGTLSGSDSNKYRKMDSGEYSYSSVTGLVSLGSAAKTRVLAYYSGSGSQSDAVTISGVGACDLLYVPPPDPSTGTLEPKLGVLNRYPTTATSSTAEAFIRNPSSGSRDEAFQAVIDSSGYVIVTRTDAASPSAGEGYRQPFASSKYADMAWLYTTDFDYDKKSSGYAPVYTRKIVVRTFSSATSIIIDKDFVAGTIEVTRDGVPDYAFSADSATGTLSFTIPPSSAEEVVVTYMRESSDRKSGSLVGALGGFWNFGPSENAWAALGGTWSLPGSSYTSDSAANPGSLNLTLGEKGGAGKLSHSLALAGRYSREDSTGTYRIEGMESTTDYACSFRPDSSTSGYTAVEISESDLIKSFPTLIGTLHSDGSTQKALKLSSGSSPSSKASFYKVEATPTYTSFKTFSFFAKLPLGASLDLKLDDGSSSSPQSSVEIGLPTLADESEAGIWRRYLLRYDAGDATVYVQDAEGGTLAAVTGASSVSPNLLSAGARLVVTVCLPASSSAWIDEVLLEESDGAASALFTGEASYDGSGLRLAAGTLPILSGLKAGADLQGALSSSPYASGGTSASIGLGFIELGGKARTVLSAEKDPSFRAGHSISLPTFSFPLKAKDEFDLDPSSGAFGRSDTANFNLDKVLSLEAAQSATWTPAATILDYGMLTQLWRGKLVAGPSWLTAAVEAKNRARPSDAPSIGANYGSAWIGSYDYLQPAYESDSDLREASGSLALAYGSGKQFLSLSLAESATPQSTGGGLRDDAYSLRLSVPVDFGPLSVEPYYKRAWTDQRTGATEGLVQDMSAAIGEIEAMPILYSSSVFSELASEQLATDFATQSKVSGLALPSATYVPETGLSISRHYGSNWYDVLVPASILFSYARDLARSSDTVTDTGVWTTNSKFAAINLFGSMGSHPLGLPFDSDEYLSTLQTAYKVPRDGSSTSLSIQSHSLTTFYAGAADQLDAENTLTYTGTPQSLAWSDVAGFSLSRRLEHHWLLDLFGLVTRNSASRKAGGEEPTFASGYLADLAERTPVMRSTISLKGGLSGVSSDAAAYSPGWTVSEGYEAKLTVPERLTFKLYGSLAQSRDASTKVTTLGFKVGVGATVSF